MGVSWFECWQHVPDFDLVAHLADTGRASCSHIETEAPLCLRGGSPLSPQGLLVPGSGPRRNRRPILAVANGEQKSSFIRKVVVNLPTT
jgi:hypothetical protein